MRAPLVAVGDSALGFWTALGTVRDHEQLLTFFDFPAEHRRHPRTDERD